MDNIINKSEFRNNVILELNSIRTNPKAYAKKLRECMKNFKGKVLRIQGTSVMTNEGASAFKEACDFLEKVTPIKALSLNQGLVNIASDYLKVIGEYEDLEEAREIDIQGIIDKYGYFSGEFRQSTDFGSSTPELIAINIIVDDGDREREMRKILFTERIKEIGVSAGYHPSYDYCTVLLFTNKFTPKIEEDKDNDKDPEIEESNKETKQDIKEISKGLIDQMANTTNEDSHDKGDNHNNQKENNHNNNNNEDEELDLPEDCIKMEKSEKIITEKGVKKKVIKTIYYMEDGSKNIEVIKEALK